MDLSNNNPKLLSDKGVALTLVGPTNVKTDIVLIIHGTDSDRYQQALDEQQNVLEDILRREGRMTHNPEERRSMATRLLAACVSGWQNIMENGQEIPCNAENVFRILSEYKWIYEQVDRAVADRSRFLAL